MENSPSHKHLFADIVRYYQINAKTFDALFLHVVNQLKPEEVKSLCEGPGPKDRNDMEQINCLVVKLADTDLVDKLKTVVTNYFLDHPQVKTEEDRQKYFYAILATTMYKSDYSFLKNFLSGFFTDDDPIH
jgi:hypothetical protein